MHHTEPVSSNAVRLTTDEDADSGPAFRKTVDQVRAKEPRSARYENLFQFAHLSLRVTPGKKLPSVTPNQTLLTNFTADPYEELGHVTVKTFDITIDVGRDAERVTALWRIVVNNAH